MLKDNYQIKIESCIQQYLDDFSRLQMNMEGRLSRQSDGAYYKHNVLISLREIACTSTPGFPIIVAIDDIIKSFVEQIKKNEENGQLHDNDIDT